MRKLVPRVARRTVLVTDTVPAVQRSVAALVMTHYLTTRTRTSGKTVVGKGDSGAIGKWKSYAIAVFHVVAGIRVPVRVQPGAPHGLHGESARAQPLDEGPQPWESRR